MRFKERDLLSLTIVIVTYNSEAVLAECLESLPAGCDGLGPYEVVVVDNASSDATVEEARRTCPAARIVEMPVNAGYAAGINAGILAGACSDAVLILNPDIRLAPSSVTRLASALDTPGIGIAVPRLVDDIGRLQLSLRREPSLPRAVGEAVLGAQRAGRWSRWGETITSTTFYEAGQTVDWATGAAMLISRACLAAVPGTDRGTGAPWDESFFLYSEETEFALRARDAGFAVRYVPTAGAVHLGGESSTSPQLWSLLVRNKSRFYARRHDRLRAAAFHAALVVGAALRAPGGGPTHRAALAGLLRPFPDPAANRAPADRNAPGWICFSAQDWWYHNRAHSDFQLMRRVAESRRVLFVNSIGMRMPRPGRSTRTTRRIIRKAQSVARRLRTPVPELPNFYVLTPLILPFYGSPAARAANALLVRYQVARTARRIGLDDPVVVVTIPTAWDVVKEMRHCVLIYNRSDKHSAFGEVDQQYIGDLETSLLSNADRVLYVSRALQADEATRTGSRALFLDHGVDVEHFQRSKGPEPDDMRSIPHPRIGFFGGLDDYVVDFDLLHRLAVELPDASLILIGDATCSMSRFASLGNVFLLGFKPYGEIPRYGSGFDVAIMPWLQNDWIQHCNPIKLKEYLALGLPVITTTFPEASYYSDVLAIAEGADEFVEMVRDALGADDQPSDVARRRAAVADSSWERRAEELMDLAESTRRSR